MIVRAQNSSTVSLATIARTTSHQHVKKPCATAKNIMPKNTQTNLPILYSFRRCPYAMRARLALYNSGIQVEIREIVLRDKPAHMLEISPKGTVPVLLLPCGKVIDESLDIMHWALEQNDPNHWLSQVATTLISQNDTKFKPLLDRYKYPNRYEGENCTNAFDDAISILDDLNQRIKENKGALLGREYTIADYAIFPFIRQFAHVDRPRFDALPLKALQNWLREHKKSETFNAIMHKYAPWKTGETPIIFNDRKEAS